MIVIVTTMLHLSLATVLVSVASEKNNRVSNRFPIVYRNSRVFHDLSTTQDWQYCQLCFDHAIEN